MGKAKVICVFGSASDVGKSATATAICRILANRGVKVAPYKAQNMSNNAGVVRRSAAAGSDEAGEMGRAQVIQAHACKVEPETDMNPVLLKPSSDKSSQVVVHGKALGEVAARELWSKSGAAQSPLRVAAHEALRRLIDAYEVVVVEGAGSCGEVNLRNRDFVNFDAAHEAVAHGAAVSVFLVCDIEKGGVFAQAVGTLAVIRPHDRALVKGIIVNKFRGDASLFDDGRAWLEEETGIPVLGVVPYFDPLDVSGDGSRCMLDSEDGLHSASRVDPSPLSHAEEKLRVAVLLLPRIANLTDFSPLQGHPLVQLDWLRTPRNLGQYAVVIIPGSKSVVRDYTWMEGTGWVPHVRHYAGRPAGLLLGVCGGYQMLGTTVRDPDGHDGVPMQAKETLGLLPVETLMLGSKRLTRTEGAEWLAPHAVPQGAKVSGYEIHTGQTEATAEGSAQPCLRLPDGTSDGAFVAHEGGAAVVGTYLHGLFDTCVDDFVSKQWEQHFGCSAPPLPPRGTLDAYDVLAGHFLRAISADKLHLLLP